MTDLRRVPVEEAIKQLEFWLDAPWPMSAADAAERATEIGWSLEDDGQVYARTNPLEPHLQVVLGQGLAGASASTSRRRWRPSS